MARFFKQFNFLVGVSLDGPKDIHDARRVSRSGYGSYDRVMRGVELLRKHQVEFNILTVLHESNINRARDLLQWYEREEIQYVQFIPAMDFRAQEPGKPPRYLITPEAYGGFMCEVFDAWYNDGEPRTSIRFFDNMLSVYLNRGAELCIHRKTCPTTLILEQNGDAYPCDFYIHEDFKLGNVGVDSLSEILNRHARHRFLTMKPALPPKCTECEYLRLCHGGCPRNRVWSIGEDAVDVDYFCDSYLKIYAHAHKRMERLARRTRASWLEDYLHKGNKEPERNAPCICGSGIKYKKCCGQLV
jgi:uncharacterized protein